MPALFLALIVRLMVEIGKAVRKHTANKPRPLCTDCAHAHVQYAANGRRAIACTFAGAVRPVQIDVMYCTDYRDRNTAPRLVQIGFARPIAAPDAVGELAKIRKLKSARCGSAATIAAASSRLPSATDPFDRSGPVRLGEQEQPPEIPTFPHSTRKGWGTRRCISNDPTKKRKLTTED
jgi:hypothetical protein